MVSRQHGRQRFIATILLLGSSLRVSNYRRRASGFLTSAALRGPANTPVTEATLRDIPEAASALGLQIRVLNASTGREIEAAFTTLGRDSADALLVATDGFFVSRRVQFAGARQ